MIDHTGGGSTITNEVARLASRNVVFCTLCDNDKLSPHCHSSATVKTGRRELEQGLRIARVFEISARDIENLIPLTIIRDHQLCPNYSAIELQNLFELESNWQKRRISDSPLRYFDMKKGFDPKSIESLGEGSSAKLWIEDAFKLPRGGELKLIPGFGDNLLTELLKNGAAMKAFIAQTRSDIWHEMFAAVFEEAIWYFAASTKTRL